MQRAEVNEGTARHRRLHFLKWKKAPPFRSLSKIWGEYQSFISMAPRAFCYAHHFARLAIDIFASTRRLRTISENDDNIPMSLSQHYFWRLYKENQYISALRWGGRNFDHDGVNPIIAIRFPLSSTWCLPLAFLGLAVIDGECGLQSHQYMNGEACRSMRCTTNVSMNLCRLGFTTETWRAEVIGWRLLKWFTAHYFTPIITVEL